MGLLMVNDLLDTISEQIMKPESKFGTQKKLLSLKFQSINIVLITIFLKILKLTKLVVGLKSQSLSFFHSY